MPRKVWWYKQVFNCILYESLMWFVLYKKFSFPFKWEITCYNIYLSDCIRVTVYSTVKHYNIWNKKVLRIEKVVTLRWKQKQKRSIKVKRSCVRVVLATLYRILLLYRRNVHSLDPLTLFRLVRPMYDRIYDTHRKLDMK